MSKLINIVSSPAIPKDRFYIIPSSTMGEGSLDQMLCRMYHERNKIVRVMIQNNPHGERTKIIDLKGIFFPTSNNL